MKRILSLSLVLLFSLIGNSAIAAPKIGSACTRVNQTSFDSGRKLICVKMGKKYVWKLSSTSTTSSKTSPAPSPATTFLAPVIPTSFDDLYQNRTGIAYGAWLKTSKVIESSPKPSIKFELLVGPHTKPWFTDYQSIIDRTGQTFPGQKIPAKVVLIYFNYSDVAWANAKLKELIPEDDYAAISSSEGGRIVDCWDAHSDCLGSKMNIAPKSLTAYVQMGVSNNLGVLTIDGGKYGSDVTELQNSKGGILSHEFFHALQMYQFNLDKADTRGVPNWIKEGAAVFAEMGVINYKSYSDYLDYRKKYIGGMILKVGMNQSFIETFLSPASWAKDPQWASSDPDWSYQLGSRVCEILVALKGPEVITHLSNRVSSGVKFEMAFKDEFGITFTEAIPIIAKTIDSNWKSGD